MAKQPIQAFKLAKPITLQRLERAKALHQSQQINQQVSQAVGLAIFQVITLGQVNSWE